MLAKDDIFFTILVSFYWSFVVIAEFGSECQHEQWRGGNLVLVSTKIKNELLVPTQVMSNCAKFKRFEKSPSRQLKVPEESIHTTITYSLL